MNIDEIFAEIKAEDLDVSRDSQEDSLTFFERTRTLSDEIDFDMVFNAKDVAALTGFCPYASISDLIIRYVKGPICNARHETNIDAFEKKYKTKVYFRNREYTSCFQLTEGSERYKLQSHIDGIIYDKDQRILFEARVKNTQRFNLSKYDIILALIHMNMTFTKECIFVYLYDFRVTSFRIKKEMYLDLFKIVKARFFRVARLIYKLKETPDLFASFFKMNDEDRNNFIHEEIGFTP